MFGGFKNCKQMKENFQNIILKSTGAQSLYKIEEIQSLWSGYGSIVRYGLHGAEMDSVVVKHVKLPERKNHPRGWNTDLSHNRKIKSYEVETAWYKQWSKKCSEVCRIPKCYALESEGDEVLMVMEDLDASGFNIRKSSVNWSDIKNCLSWLANFHATFLNEAPDELWKTGTYWHLETRPEELEAMGNTELRHNAPAIDEVLNKCKYQTFVHGDAKLANFCFSNDGKKVSAVDFQYVGGGCGMKDVAYFVGSCLYEDDCEQMEDQLLECYFKEFKKAVEKSGKSVDCDDLEKHWREMYYFAWADFHRFLKGWSPGHWKINSYSERVSREVIDKLKIR